MIRLFAALPLPDNVRARLAALSNGIEGARWVAAEDLHITLRFIGDIQEDRGDDAYAALGAVQFEPISVTLSGAGHFGTAAKAHSIWIGVERTPELAALHERIDRALVRAGFPPEGRKFLPHVTLARLGRARSHHVRGWLEANGAFFALPFAAGSFVLYESRRAHYLPLAEFPLS